MLHKCINASIMHFRFISARNIEAHAARCTRETSKSKQDKQGTYKGQGTTTLQHERAFHLTARLETRDYLLLRDYSAATTTPYCTLKGFIGLSSKPQTHHLNPNLSVPLRSRLPNSPYSPYPYPYLFVPVVTSPKPSATVDDYFKLLQGRAEDRPGMGCWPRQDATTQR